MKYAKVVETWGRLSPNGREKKWTLRTGKSGRGKIIAIVTYLPWSGPSVEEAECYVIAAARRAGVEVVW